MAYIKPTAEIIMFDISDIIVTSLHDMPDVCSSWNGDFCSKDGDSEKPCQILVSENNPACLFGLFAKINSTDPNPPSDI